MKTYTFHVSIPDSAQAWRKVELMGDQTLQDLHVAIQDALGWKPDDNITFFLGDDPLGDGQSYVIFDMDDDGEEDEDWDEDDLLEEDMEDDLSKEEIEARVDGLPRIDIGDKPKPQSMEEMIDLLDRDPDLRAQVAKMMTDQLGVPSFLVNMVLNNAKSLVSTMPEDMLSSLIGSGPEPLDAAEALLDSLDLAEGRTFLYVFGEDDWRFDVRVEAIHAEADANAIYPRLLQAKGLAPEQYVDWDEVDEEWLWDDEEEDEDEFDERDEDE